MVAKLRVKEVIIDRLKENEQEFISKLKALVAILKSPSKYQQFTKTLAWFADLDHFVFTQSLSFFESAAMLVHCGINTKVKFEEKGEEITETCTFE